MRPVAAFAGLLMLDAPAEPRRKASRSSTRARRINLAIGFSVGGGYDLYARHLARHIGKHIPGNPTILPQNMAGAGSLRAANFIYTAAPKDGTAFGTFARTTGINPLLESGATFDGTKFSWLGSVTDDVTPLRHLAHHAGEDLGRFPEEADHARRPGAELGARHFRPPVQERVRRADQARAGLSRHQRDHAGDGARRGRRPVRAVVEHDQDAARAWLRDKKINLLVQSSFKKVPELGDVPLVIEQTKDTEKLQILKLFLAAQEMARPFAAPPGIPADRKAALVAAFDATMKDPEYLADAKKLDIDVNPVSGKALEELLAELYATPKEVLKKAGEAVTK